MQADYIMKDDFVYMKLLDNAQYLYIELTHIIENFGEYRLRCFHLHVQLVETVGNKHQGFI